MSRVDARLRIAGALALFFAAAALNQRPFLTIAAALAGLLLLGTALTRFCPLYTALGLTTVRKEGGG